MGKGPKQLLALGQKNGGSVFYEVAFPYIEALLQKGETARAKCSLEQVRRVLNPLRGSILKSEISDLEKAPR